MVGRRGGGEIKQLIFYYLHLIFSDNAWSVKTTKEKLSLHLIFSDKPRSIDGQKSRGIV